MERNIVQYKSWSATLYSTGHGAPHCTVQVMERHIVQYKPPSPVRAALHRTPYGGFAQCLQEPVSLPPPNAFFGVFFQQFYQLL